VVGRVRGGPRAPGGLSDTRGPTSHKDEGRSAAMLRTRATIAGSAGGRSIPPASARLALRPVPAPPSIHGRAAALLRRNRSRILLRIWENTATCPICVTVHHLQEGPRRRVDEGRVVDLLVAELEAGPRRRGQTVGRRRGQRNLGGRGAEWLAGAPSAETSLERDGFTLDRPGTRGTEPVGQVMVSQYFASSPAARSG
jgi:hypothetical protein